MRAFGEEFGRDDQFINIVGGGYGVWKASLYNNDIPHNYSFNVLSPLTGNDSTLQLGPGGTYPNAQNPATWHPYNLSTQRNTWGGNAEFSNKSPWFIKADYNEVRTNGVMPGSAQLGTGSGNGSIELGKPVDYKTQNATIEGGYNSRQYGFKLGLPRLEVHRRQRQLPVDELLHAERPRHDADAARQRAQEVEPQRLHQAAAVGLGDHRALHAERTDEQLRHRRIGPQADGERGEPPIRRSRRARPIY